MRFGLPIPSEGRYAEFTAVDILHAVRSVKAVKGLISGNRVVSVRTIGQTDFEHVHLVCFVLDEVFLGNVPCHSGRREESVLVVGSEN